MLVCKYVDWNGLAAVLATKRSADVALEVNLGDSVTHGSQSMQTSGSTLTLRPRDDDIRSPKTGDQYPSKKLKKNFVINTFSVSR